MATAFQSGFKMGGDAYNQAERNRLAQEELAMAKQRDARAAELHKQNLEEGGLRVAGLRRVNDATDNLDRVTRVGVQNPDAIKANDADFDMAVEATGRGLAMPKAAPMQQEWRGATPVELNQAQMGLAAARGDVTGMETLRVGRKGIDYEEGYKKYTKEWADMDDAAKGALIDKLSLDSGVKGYGSWVPGKGKQAGYMNYLPPGGDPIKLSAKEAGDLYTLSNLMQVDPLRARGEMDKVSDKVRAIAAQAFEAQSKGVTANNQATRFGNADANDAARLDILDKELGIKRDVAAFNRSRLLQKDKLDASATDFQSKVDGVLEGYQAAMASKNPEAAAIYAREYDQLRATAPKGLRIPPSIRSLNDAQRPDGSSKAVEVPEQGKIMMRGGKRYMTDGLGGEIEVDARGRALGVMPGDRDNFVTKTLGMPPAMANELEYSKDGRYILAPNGAEYDTQDPQDMKRIKDDVLAFAARDPDEYERRMLASRYPAPTGFGPRITARPADGAPSIYAGPEAWAAYRARQQQQ